MKKFRIQLLSMFLLSLLLMACSSYSPKQNENPVDTERPILVLTGGDDLETTSNAVTIEGQLGDNVGITSFTYSLNYGTSENVLSSLDKGRFSFTINNLREINTITLIAEDVSRNQVAMLAYVRVVPFLNVQGNWQNLAMDYTACNQFYDGKIMIDFVSVKQDGSVRGVGKALLNNQATKLDIDGSINKEDIITGDVVMAQGDQFFTGNVSLMLKDGRRVGNLTLTNWFCPDGSEEVIRFDVELTKESILSPSLDKIYEPNNQPSEAIDVVLPFKDYDVLVNEADTEDWFKFSLSEQQVVFGFVKSTQTSFQGTDGLTFYTKDLVKINPANSFGSMLLEPGSYYAKVATTDQSNYYHLEITANPLPDKQYEPNQNKEQAKEYIISPQYSFKSEGIVTHTDEDWFAFTLYTPGTLNLVVETLAGIEYTLYQGDTVLGIYESNSQPVKQTLETGTYHLRIAKKSSYPFISYLLSATMN